MGDLAQKRMSHTQRNIGGSSDDAFYRYKMPALVIRTEGRGNGIKTNIVNLVDVAGALERDPDHIVHFLSYHLNTLARFDTDHKKATVNGERSMTDLTEALEEFINTFVLCKVCGNPETVVQRRRLDQSSISLLCKACGASTLVSKHDRMCEYLKKQLPATAETGNERKRKKEEEEEEGAKEDDGRKMEVSALSEILKAYRKGQTTTEATAKALRETGEDEGVVICATIRILRGEDRPAKLVEIFKGSVAPLLRRYLRVATGGSASPRLQRFILKSIIQLATKWNPSSIAVAPHVLLASYRGDLVDETEIMKVYEDAKSRENLRTYIESIEPVIRWLTEAEEEEEEGEEGGGTG